MYLQNVLAGVDQLVHGNNLSGWGSSVLPDPVLLVPRGFDAGTSRFRYDVNPRFAETRPSRNIALNPFRLSIDFSLNLSTNYDLQQLRRAIEPVRGPDGVGWRRRTADSLTAFYLSNTSDVYKAVLEFAPRFAFPSKAPAQVTSLRRADSAFSARVRDIYVPLGEFLARGEGSAAGKVELDSVQTVSKAYWKIFWEQPEIADSLLTPSQKELIPLVKNMAGVPKEAREHSQWQFGRPVLLMDKPRRP